MQRFGYKPLEQTTIGSGVCYVIDVEAPEPIKIDSPAIAVMTDLRRVQTATIAPDATLSTANYAMSQNKVRQLIVIGDEGRIVGVLTTNDLLGERPVQVAQGRGLKYGELLVRDIMTPIGRIDVLKLYDIEHAEVGHIVATLKSAGRIHALVVEEDAEGHQCLRGVFSAVNIARQIGIEVITHETARTFAEIEAVIAQD